MLTREQKETMLNQILELMTAIAYDEPVESAPAPAEKKADKVKMLTVKECTELSRDFPSTLSVCLLLRTRSSISAQARVSVARFLSTRLTCLTIFRTERGENMCEYNKNDLRSSIYVFDDAEQEELYYKMLHTLFYRGFYAAANKDCDPCHFLTEQEQNVYKSALDFYNSIPF